MTEAVKLNSGLGMPAEADIHKIADNGFLAVSGPAEIEFIDPPEADKGLERALKAGKREIDGKTYMPDAKGALMPLEAVKPADALEDELVRKVMFYADALSAQIARFKGYTATDLGDFDALLEQEYGVKKGGRKGNRTYQSYDGLLKVSVQVADTIDFGPQLQIAKEKLDECMNEWTANARPEIRAIVTKAFNTDKEGRVNRSEIFMLLRLNFEDERWQEAMRAIKDAMRVVCSKEYIRFHKRADIQDGWQAVSIDIAKK